ASARIFRRPIQDTRHYPPRRYPRFLPPLWSQSQRVERGKSVPLCGREPRAHPRAVGKSFGARAGRRAHALARSPPRRAQGTSALAAGRINVPPPQTALPRWCGNLDQFRNLRFRERRLQISRCHRVLHDRVKPDDLVRYEHILREELVAQALRDTFRYAGKFGETLERGGIGIHPVDALAISLHEASEDVLTLLQCIRVGNEHADRVAPDPRNGGGSRHNTGFALFHGVDPEWRLSPADIDATGDDLIEGRDSASNCRRPRLEAVLLDQVEHVVLAGGVVGPISDGLAVDILDRFDRRGSLDVPIVGGAGRARPDHPQRRALAIGPQHADRTDVHSHVAAARPHRRFALPITR